MARPFNQVPSSSGVNNYHLSKKAKSRRFTIYIGCFLFLLGVLIWYLASIASKTTSALDNKKKSNLNLVNIPSWKTENDPAALDFLKKYPIKQKEKLYSSLCPMLYDCFPGDFSNFKREKTCFRALDNVISSYDSSILMSDNEVVGFSSFYLENDVFVNSDRAALIMYNVCIHPNHRGKGLGVKLMNQSTTHWIEHHGRKNKKTLLALDVDFKSLTSPHAFSMYAKLGYLRGWQPCVTVGEIDWRPLYHGVDVASAASEGSPSPSPTPPPPTPLGPPLHSALSALLQDPTSYIANVLYPSAEDKSVQMRKEHNRLPYRKRYPVNQIYDHFSMFKFYGESLGSLVEPLAKSIQAKTGSKSQ